MIERVVTADLFKEGRTRVLKKGELLHSPMEQCRSIGFVKSGRIALNRILSSGKTIQMHCFNPGSLYSELIVFSGINYPGWLTAVSDSTVIELDLESLLDILQDKKMLLSFLSGISHNVMGLTNMIEILSQKTVKQKIAYYLLSMSEGVFNESITSFSTHLGCSREALSRALAELEKHEIIRRKGTTIHAVNKAELENILFDDSWKGSK